MFVILLTYVKPLDVVDGLMREHMAYLDRHYAEGTFLLSGRRIPRTGGVIIATGHDPDLIQALVNEDPFVRVGAATTEIIHFNASQVAARIRGSISKNS